MSRSWREERTTPKEQPKKLPRPRVSDFAREYYQGRGYKVDDTVTAPTGCACGATELCDCDHKDEFCGWKE